MNEILNPIVKTCINKSLAILKLTSQVKFNISSVKVEFFVVNNYNNNQHNPAPVQENDSHKLLWDFNI